MGNSTSHGDCEKEESTYINFQPKSLSYTFMTSFETPENIPNLTYIHEYLFGVVNAEVTLYKEDLNSKQYIRFILFFKVVTTIDYNSIAIWLHQKFMDACFFYKLLSRKNLKVNYAVYWYDRRHNLRLVSICVSIFLINSIFSKQLNLIHYLFLWQNHNFLKILNTLNRLPQHF